MLIEIFGEDSSLIPHWSGSMLVEIFGGNSSLIPHW